MPKKAHQRQRAEPTEPTEKEESLLQQKVLSRVNKILHPSPQFSGLRMHFTGKPKKAIFYYELEGSSSPQVTKNALMQLEMSFAEQLKKLFGYKMQIEFFPLESLPTPKILPRFLNQIKMQLAPQELSTVQECEAKQEELSVVSVMHYFNRFILQQAPVFPPSPLASEHWQVDAFFLNYAREMNKLGPYVENE